jgi:hypothetical protein
VTGFGVLVGPSCAAEIVVGEEGGSRVTDCTSARHAVRRSRRVRKMRWGAELKIFFNLYSIHAANTETDFL